MNDFGEHTYIEIMSQPQAWKQALENVREDEPTHLDSLLFAILSHFRLGSLHYLLP